MLLASRGNVFISLAPEEVPDVPSGKRELDCMGCPPEPRQINESTTLFVSNLLLMIFLGSAFCLWVLHYTDLFPAVGGFIAFTGAFSWVAFVSKKSEAFTPANPQFPGILVEPVFWTPASGTPIPIQQNLQQLANLTPLEFRFKRTPTPDIVACRTRTGGPPPAVAPFRRRIMERIARELRSAGVLLLVMVSPVFAQVPISSGAL